METTLERVLRVLRWRVAVRHSGCWEWQGYTQSSGHGMIKHQGTTRYAHRVAYETIHGEIPEGLVLLHACDNPRCVNPDHLTPGSHEANVADRVAKGRSARGTENGRSKLTEAAVVRIIEELSQSGSTAIARKYGVDPKVVRNIRDGKSWAHIPRQAQAA